VYNNWLAKFPKIQKLTLWANTGSLSHSLLSILLQLPWSPCTCWTHQAPSQLRGIALALPCPRMLCLQTPAYLAPVFHCFLSLNYTLVWSSLTSLTFPKSLFFSLPFSCWSGHDLFVHTFILHLSHSNWSPWSQGAILYCNPTACLRGKPIKEVHQLSD
jgi:hypothetical protein